MLENFVEATRMWEQAPLWHLSVLPTRLRLYTACQAGR